MQTPVQKAGYKIGQEFRVLRGICGFTVGQIVTLNRDDGSSAPMFKGANKQHRLADNWNSEGAYLGLDKVEPVEKSFKAGDRVKVISVDGNGFETGSLGKIGTIRKTDSTSLPVLMDFDDGDNDWGKYEELEAYIAPAIPACAFKEGDRVRVVGQDTGFYSWHSGQEGEIVQLDLDDSLDVRVRFDDGDYDWGRLSSVELVNPEVAIKAASVKEKLAEIARLTAEVQELLG